MDENGNTRDNSVEQQQTSDGAANLSSTVIPVIEEHLQVGKKSVETGKIRISKNVTEYPTTVNIPLSHEEYDIERVAINQRIETPPPAVRYEGDTMIIPVLREVLVVEKRYELIEEVRITKRKTEKIETQQITLLKEEVNIERTGATNNQEPGAQTT